MTYLGIAHGIFGFNEAVEETAELVKFASLDGVARVRQHPNAEKPLPRFAKVMKADSMTSSRSQYVTAGYSQTEIDELYGEVCIVASSDKPTKRVVCKVDNVEVYT